MPARRIALALLGAAVLFGAFPMGSPSAVAAPYSSGETRARDLVFEMPATGPGTVGASSAVPQALAVEPDGTVKDWIGSTGEPTLNYTSPVIDAGQLFDRVGAWWTGADSEAAESVAIEARASADGTTWGEWTLLRAHHDISNEAAATYYANPQVVAVGRYAQYRVWLPDGSLTSVRRVGLTFLDVTDLNAGFVARLGNDLRTAFAAFTQPLYAEAAPVGATRIKTRAEWGADESRMRWTPNYKRNHTKAVVHHTVTSDGGTNVAAELRSIYYFHAVTRGWGDIGYQYLVDKYGNIWQGRQGGDHVEGGHAYGWNNGTFAVSAIGDYSTRAPTSALQGAIANIIAMKFTQYGIQPFGADPFIHQEQRRDGSWSDVSGTPPNILGHRDANYVAGATGGQTACPGSTIANMMEGLRRLTQAAVVTGYTQMVRLDPNTPRGTFPGSTLSVSVVVANKGATQIPAGTTVGYQVVTSAGAVVAPGAWVPLASALAPGATTTVSVPFSGPPAGSWIVRWDLRTGSAAWGTIYGTPVRDQWIFSRDWGADWRSDTVPGALAAGEPRTVTATILNDGGRPWPHTGTNPVKVTWGWTSVATGNQFPGGKASLPYTVQPGQTVTVSIPLVAPQYPTSYRLRLDLEKENEFKFGEKGIAPEDSSLAVVLDAKASYSVGPLPPMKADETVTVPVTVTNLGRGIFPTTSASPVTLGYHWYDSAGKTVVYEGLRTRLPADLAPGASVALEAQVKAPSSGGTYTLKFDLVQEGVAWLSTRGVATADRSVSVIGPLIRSYAVRYEPQVTSLAAVGQQSGIPMALTNSGNWTWPAAGANPVTLSYHWWSLTTNKTVLWEGARTRLPADVPPGGSVSVSANVKFPTTAGTYLLRWDMVEEGVQWFSGKGVPTGDQFVRVEIPKAFTYGSSMVATAPASMAPAATVSVPVRVQNLGQTVWDGSVNLSYHWTDSAGRVVVWEGLRTSLDLLAPQQVRDVAATVRAPTAAGTYTLTWDIVREGHAWFSGQGVLMPSSSVKVEAGAVTPAPAPATGTYGAVYAPQLQTVSAAPGATVVVPVMIANSGTLPWQPGSVNVAYHLVDSSGAMAVWDGERTRLLSPVLGGQVANVNLAVRAPSTPGTYTIRIDLVQEGVAWFSGEGVPVATVGLTVR